MGNFIGLVFGVLKEKGIDTSGMSVEEAIAKYNELGLNEGDSKSKEDKISQLRTELDNAQGFLKRAKILQEINALESGFDNVSDYLEYKEAERQAAIEKREKEKEKRLKQQEIEKQQKEQKLKQEIKVAPKHKKEQFEIIQKTNPMLDDYHTGIRSPADIKTFEETIQDDDSFTWGDFSKEDAEKAVQTGEITLYSSYPIKQGTFVSTSYRQAEEYAGGVGGKVYSKKVKLKEVAWINGDEGQYAKV